MSEIICPNCKISFNIENTGYSQIVKQVRDKEFKEERIRITKQEEEKKNNEIDNLRLKAIAHSNKQKEPLEKQIQDLNNKLNNQTQNKDIEKTLAIENALKPMEKESINLKNTIEKLEKELNNKTIYQVNELKNFETEKELAINKAVEIIKTKNKDLEIELNRDKSSQQDTITKLQEQLKSLEKEQDKSSKLAVSEALYPIEKEKNNLENKINNLKNQLNNEKVIQDNKLKDLEIKKELDIKTAVEEIKDKNKNLEYLLKTKDLEKDNLEISLKDKYLAEIQSLKDTNSKEIKVKEEQIEFYKDMKQKLSTKGIGESLEQYCEDKFNELRPIAFPMAEFGKDNDIVSNTKGDFIYRENDEFGNEIISIMFEMKNENDDTKVKQKNESFFKKLDKDRENKDCEYAILVSLLESDSDYYNNGIVDVSYKFKKMYVVRPQFFIPIISLLRNSALKSMKYKQEMEAMKKQNSDVTGFETKLNSFRDGFKKNFNSASNNFQDAIKEIDKSIKAMESIKKKLTTTENQLRLANNKTQDLTIKKLTYGNKTMKAKFDDVKPK